MRKNLKLVLLLAALGLIGVTFVAVNALSSSPLALAENEEDNGGSRDCRGLPSHSALTDALKAEVDDDEADGGLGNDMWATVVNRDGVVCAVTMSGDDRGDQWPGSRVISAQKANTANAFSLPGNALGFAAPLSTAQLWTAVQPRGSLFGLQFSNPVDTNVAYRGNPRQYGTARDPMVGRKIGGVNVFGGGLALYGLDEDDNPVLMGGIGLSGDTSCADHVLAWKIRDALGLDNVPGGVNDGANDNMIIAPDNALEAAFAHPSCSPVGQPVDIVDDLPTTHPIGP